VYLVPKIGNVDGACIFRLVVSAPYGQVPGGALGRTIREPSTGVIYQCPINPGTCGGLTDPDTASGVDRRLYDPDR